jgi:hypothetical protein
MKLIPECTRNVRVTISSQHALSRDHAWSIGNLREALKLWAAISVDDVLRPRSLMITYLRKWELELERLGGRGVPESPTQRNSIFVSTMIPTGSGQNSFHLADKNISIKNVATFAEEDRTAGHDTKEIPNPDSESLNWTIYITCTYLI